MNYERINNDEIKNPSKAKKIFAEYMKNNKNIVIDNTNAKKSQREYYVSLGKKNGYYLIALEFKLDKELAMYFNDYRGNNDFRDHISKRISKVVIHTFYKNSEKFTTNEVDEIIEINFLPVIFKEEIDYFNMYIEK